MNQRFAVPLSNAALTDPEPGPPQRAAPAGERTNENGFDPQTVFELIERTVTNVRWLQQENERIGMREQVFRGQFEQERAQWRTDADKLREVAEALLERATAAEAHAEETAEQARLAMLMCREAQDREQHAGARAERAEKRAQTAEQWLGKINKALNEDVGGLFRT